LAEETGQEKTEQATQKRREEARAKGQVARSLEINSALMLFFAFGTMFVFRNHILRGIDNIITEIFSLAPKYSLTITNTRLLIVNMTYRFFLIIYPFFIVMFAAGIIVNILQVGFLFSGETLVPKIEKINPFEGMKRLFSRRTLESLIRDLIKITIVGWIGYSVATKYFSEIMKMADSDVGTIFFFSGKIIFSVTMKILIGYAVIAILDYAFQKWDYERSMMMTRQEIKEELKQSEGDPLLRARIRSMQREMARRRMMEEVPKADVVITNPTEIAVALLYDHSMLAPVVVAKGKRFIAERIREAAINAGVPIVENVLLAQTLYKSVDIGHPIPGELYSAVAEVLAYVYRLKRKKL